MTTNGDHGDERDPLLVRPFVLRDSGAPDDDSPQTWPAEPVRDEPPVDDADAPTAILHLPFRRKHAAAPSPARGNHRRRVLVLAGAAAVVVLGAAAAGFAALRDDVRPAVSTGLPGGPVPAATAPLATSAAASPTLDGSDPAGGRPGAGAPDGSTTGATTTPTGATSTSATPATSTPSGSPSAGQPISLIPPSTGGDPTTAPTRAPQGVAPEPPSSDRTGVIRGQNSLCLDLNGAVPVDGNHIQVYDCNNTIAQSWTLATDGTLRVQGKCALAVGDNSVEIVSCDGRTPAQWRASNQRLINVATNTCLTDPSSGRRAGTGVTVATCTGSAAQRWSLP